MRIFSYLTFNGNCREAMEFYRSCFGGELTLQTVADTPFSNELQPEIKGLILQAVLKNQNFLLLGTDLSNSHRGSGGNAVSMFLACNTREEIIDCYHQLGNGGKESIKLDETYGGGLSGVVIDRFGNQWLLYYSS